MYTLQLAETKQHIDSRLGEWLTFGPDNQYLLFYGLHGDEQGQLFDQHKNPLTYIDLLAKVPANIEKVFIAPCFPALVASQAHPENIEVLGYWTWPTCIETWDNALHICGYFADDYLTDKASALWQSVERGELEEEEAMDTEQELFDTFYPENLDDLEDTPLLDYAMGTYESEDY